MITRLLESLVSAKRVEQFLKEEEIDVKFIENSPSEKNQLELLKGNFYWLDEEDKKKKEENNVDLKKGSKKGGKKEESKKGSE
jgi:hypothetical protein